MLTGLSCLSVMLAHLLGLVCGDDMKDRLKLKTVGIMSESILFLCFVACRSLNYALPRASRVFLADKNDDTVLGNVYK